MNPTNIEELMKAAKEESHTMEPPVDDKPSENIQPKLNPEDMKNALNNANLSTVVSQMSDDPDKVKEMMEGMSNQMTPEMMEMARKMASGGQGKQLLREMQRQGMDPNVLKEAAKHQKRALRKASVKLDSSNTTFFVINTKRQLKTSNLVFNGEHVTSLDVKGLEIPCSRLAQGPLSGKTIKAWYDPSFTTKNRRASKIAGLRVGGDLLLMVEDGGVTSSDFVKAEDCLA